MLVRRSVFELVGFFNPELKHGDDTDWFLRAEARGVALEVIPETLVSRRLHKANRSRQWAARSRDEYLDLVKARLDRRRAEG
jgi:GT2 family glycosyltransferase